MVRLLFCGGKLLYRYSGDQMIAEADVAGGVATLKARYIRGNGLVARKDEHGKAYYLHNGHGDVVGLMDASGQMRLNSYSYDIWGNIASQREAVPQPFKYSGELWDSTTSLQYLRARWYDPSMGRFVNEDTYQGQINNPLSLNLYTYVANNPLTRIDPSGHMSLKAQWAFLKGEVAGFGSGVTALFRKETYTGAWGLAKGLWNKEITLSEVGSALGQGILEPLQYQIDNMDHVLFGDPTTDEAYAYGYALGQVENFVLATTASAKAIISIIKNTPKVAKAMGLCQCFTAGTKVLTDDGEKNIEDIEVGDKVLSKDEVTGEVAYKEITATFNHETDEIYQIHVGDQVIESTFNHPFYVEGKGWTFVKDLKPGDLLVQSDGNTLEITSVELLHKNVTVYNMTVDEFHTYFVSDLGIWVHNTGPCGLSATTLATMGKTNKGIAGLEDAYISKDKVLDTVKEFLGEGYSTGVAKNGYTTYVSKNGNYVARYGYKKDGSLELNLENDLGGNFHIEVK